MVQGRFAGIVRKAALYTDHGVPEYWILDPEGDAITVNELVDGQYVPVLSHDGVARSNVIPGFQVEPNEIFSEPEWLQNDDD